MPGKTGIVKVRALLETDEYLLHPDVDAAHSFIDLRMTAYHGKNQANIDSAEKETNMAVDQAGGDERARKEVPPAGNADIWQDRRRDKQRVTPDPDMSAAIAEAPAIVDALLSLKLREEGSQDQLKGGKRLRGKEDSSSQLNIWIRRGESCWKEHLR